MSQNTLGKDTIIEQIGELWSHIEYASLDKPSDKVNRAMVASVPFYLSSYVDRLIIEATGHSVDMGDAPNGPSQTGCLVFLDWLIESRSPWTVDKSKLNAILRLRVNEFTAWIVDQHRKTYGGGRYSMTDAAHIAEYFGQRNFYDFSKNDFQRFFYGFSVQNQLPIFGTMVCVACYDKTFGENEARLAMTAFLAKYPTSGQQYQQLQLL